MIVVDASVAVKWFIEEPDSAAADALLLRFGRAIHAPDLLLIETAGAIVRRHNERSQTHPEMIESASVWRFMWQNFVQAHRTGGDEVIAATGIAADLGHPLKDCLYLALAIRLGCDLATSDVRFRDRAGSRYPQVRLLAELVS